MRFRELVIGETNAPNLLAVAFGATVMVPSHTK